MKGFNGFAIAFSVGLFVELCDAYSGKLRTLLTQTQMQKRALQSAHTHLLATIEPLRNLNK
ncbi:hypothetical protein [Nostoc sp.]|uniref:hypothetical protein n=1 Tax=Nostoc sp. TaxID=1180 RepID=UPI002FF6D663